VPQRQRTSSSVALRFAPRGVFTPGALRFSSDTMSQRECHRGVLSKRVRWLRDSSQTLCDGDVGFALFLQRRAEEFDPRIPSSGPARLE